MPSNAMSQKPRRKSPEAEMQKSIMRFVFAQQAQHPELKLLYHPANGGYRTPREAGEFRAMGVRPGVSDLHLPVRNALNQYIGLWIELKSGKNTVTGEQAEWLRVMQLQGHRVCTCRTVSQALHIIACYIGADWSHELHQMPESPSP